VLVFLLHNAVLVQSETGSWTNVDEQVHRIHQKAVRNSPMLVSRLPEHKDKHVETLSSTSTDQEFGPWELISVAALHFQDQTTNLSPRISSQQGLKETYSFF
jgi:hypothetical protein